MKWKGKRGGGKGEGEGRSGREERNAKVTDRETKSDRGKSFRIFERRFEKTQSINNRTVNEKLKRIFFFFNVPF